jgi:hypothetical protein
MAEEEENLASQKNAIEASKGELKEAGLSEVEHLFGGLSNLLDEVEDVSKVQKRAKEKLVDLELEDIGIGSNGALTFYKSIEEFTEAELIKLSSFLK